MTEYGSSSQAILLQDEADALQVKCVLLCQVCSVSVALTKHLYTAGPSQSA